NATVTVSFDPSIRNTARTIPITFSGASTVAVNIVQAAGEGGMDVTVVPQVVNIAGNGDAVFVTLGSTGNWTASKSDSWISVSPTSGSSGQGQTLTISASRNTGAARTGTVTVSCGNISRTITVNQATDSELLVSSNAVTLGANSGSQEDVTVYASGMWELDEYSNIWVDAIYTAHAGDPDGEALTFRTKSANTSGSSRSVTIRVRLVDNQNVYQEITVTQPSSSTLYVSPTASQVGNGVGTGFIHVTSNTSWHITSIEEGISIASSAQSGTGDADVMFAYTANPDEEIRRCRVYFETTDGEKSAMFTLIQAAATPAIVIEPDSALWFSSGEGGTLQLTRVVTCTGAWTAASSQSWLTASPASGSAGSTTVTFTARASLTEVLHAIWTVTCGDKTKTLAAHCVPVPSEL
ncbi:MAG: BACON domain-containing protein, partial [Clostridia bacterium]|nr:BACON domain-containing protein [Clostridia bacterium]